MLRTIEQIVTLRATPRAIYRTFLSSREHSAMTGFPASVSARPGSAFTAFGGVLSGSNLLLVRDRLIVQRWRSNKFRRSDVDSILMISLEPFRGGTRIHLVHVNVPSHDFKGVTRGWNKYYWRPWAAYLAGRKPEGK